MIVLSTAVAASAASTVPIITYGGGELLQQLFNAIAMVASGPTYLSLLKITLIVGLSWFAIDGICLRKHIETGIKWLVCYYVTFTILLLPKVTVQLIDRVNPNHQLAVSGVPWGLAIPASIGSQIGDALTRTFEKIFSLPGDLNYSQTGMVLASKLAAAATSFQITDPIFAQNLNGYVNQCVFYDLLLHKYSLNQLLESDNIWQLITANASPARAFAFNDGQKASIVTCQAGANLLSKSWNGALNQTAANYGQRLFPSQDNNAAKAALLSRLPLAYGYLTHLSLSASEILQQNLMRQAISQGLQNFAARVNAAAALNNYAFAKAQVEKRSVYATLGEQAAYWLPLLQNVLTALIYGIFLLILPFVLLPIGMSVLRSYFLAIVWVQLWGPLNAMLNMAMTLYASHGSTAAVTLNGQSGLSFMTMANLAQVNQDMSLLAGYLAMSVPLISYGIISHGILPAFSQLAQYVGGMAQHTAQSVANETVTGNLSQGNLQFDNNNAYTTSAYHWDTQGSALAGSMTYGLGDGAVMTRTASGAEVVNSQGAISSTAATIHLGESIRDSANEQADASMSAVMGQTQAASDASTAGLRQMLDYAGSHGHSTASAENSSLSHSAGVNESMNNVKSLIDRFSKEQHLSAGQGAQVLGSWYAFHDEQLGVNSSYSLPGKIVELTTGVSGGVKAEMGNRLDGSHFNKTEMQTLMQEAKNFYAQTGFSHQVDTAIHAVQEASFRNSSEENRHLSEGIGSHFERAFNAREEVQNNLARAESFHQMANYAEEQSATIDYNASGEFVDWMAKQKDPGGHGAMGVAQAESLINHYPHIASAYEKDFVREQTAAWQQQWHERNFNAATVTQDFEQNNQGLKPEQTVELINSANKLQVQEQSPVIVPASDQVTKAQQQMRDKIHHELDQQQQQIQHKEIETKADYQKNSNEVNDALSKVK